MCVKTISRNELKKYYQNEKANVALEVYKKIDVDLEPTLVLFSKIYIYNLKTKSTKCNYLHSR